MLKNNVNWPVDRIYKSKTKWEPMAFFTDSLCNSKTFDLELGFFSSSAINVLSEGFALFIYNGGKMRMAINNILLEEDKQLVMEGGNENSAIPFDLTNLKMLKETFSKRDKHFFDCLSYLISQDRLELKVVQPKGGLGIAHTKQGLFNDGENTVGFTGSCNFTGAALLTNIESFTIFCDWENGYEKKRVEAIRRSFERLFNEEDKNVEYLDASQVSSYIVNAFPTKQLKELLEEEERIYRSKKDKEKTRPAVLDAIKRAKKEIDRKIKEAEMKKIEPRFPFEKPREYQQLAFERWKDNGQKGLFAMATGTGKTITSLNCLLEIYKRLGYYKAVILVPTITLADQWEDECRKFNFGTLVKINSRNPSWKDDLSVIRLNENTLPENKVNYVVISTYASFARKNIFNEINSLSSKTLFIADECHNMGSPKLQALFPRIRYKRRIGLSATPERQYDEEGTNNILAFFGSEKEYTYEYSMREAIENGVLCRYYYFPHLVELTEEEMEDYREVSLRIAQFYDPDGDSFKNNPVLTALLLRRKRIIHKAYNKLLTFKNILKEIYKENGSLKYTMIYVPEGSDTNDYYEVDFYESYDEDSKTLDDDIRLIDHYNRAVIDIDTSITAEKFTARENNREEILERFTDGSTHVLTSMKCLDEGVDVPRAEVAIFIASTENPRQFIQRRGRILRNHPDKDFAYIYDLVVVPKMSKDGETYEMERSMFRKELARVKNFSELAENRAYTTGVLLDIMQYYNLNLYSND